MASNGWEMTRRVHLARSDAVLTAAVGRAERAWCGAVPGPSDTFVLVTAYPGLVDCRRCKAKLAKAHPTQPGLFEEKP